MQSASRHLKEVFGTLRFRLTIWNTLVVLAMVIVTLWGVREGLRLTLRQEADSQLAEDAREVQLMAEQLDLEMFYKELDRKAISHTHRGFFVQVFNTERRMMWQSEGGPAAKIPFDRVGVNQKPISFEDYRIVSFDIDRGEALGWVVRVGVSHVPIETDVAQITRLMLVVGAVVLVMSPLGGYWLAGRATRPLAHIIDTTGRLHPSSLEERLPIRGTNDELDRLSVTINGFLDRIAEFVRQNREFTANAAHELRSPLTAIQSSLEVALNTDRTLSEYKELLLEILEECGGLRMVVNQLLLLAESDAGLLTAGTQSIQFDRIVQKAVEMFQGVAEMAEIQLRLRRLEPAKVDADAGRLRQVINNLIDNAIKFTRKGGRIDVNLTVLHDRSVRLSVDDTGIGVPPEDVPHIFERFYLPDKARRREAIGRGSGLGLSICKAIVTAYRGKIEMHSVLDKGTTIVVTFPPSTRSDQVGQPGSAAASDRRGQAVTA